MTFGEVVLLVIIIILLYLLDQERKLHGHPGIPILGELFDSATGVEERPPISTATTEEHPPFNADELKELEKAKHKKSPPPEKPECEVKSLRSTKTAQTESDQTKSVDDLSKSKPKDDNNNVSQKQQTLTPLITSPTASTPPPPAKKYDDSSRQTRQSLYLPAPGEKSPNAPPPVRTPKTSTYLSVQNQKSQDTPSTPTASTPPPPAKKYDDSSRQTRQSLYLPAPGEKSPNAPPPARSPKTSAYLSVQNPKSQGAPSTPTPATPSKKYDDSSRQARQSLYLPAPGEKSPNVQPSKTYHLPIQNEKPPSSPLKKYDDSSRQTRQSLYLPAPGEKSPNAPPPARSPKTSTYLSVQDKKPSNPKKEK
uniref:Uncharacterized protein n=1 Tax=Panagrolaimus davidi TaxID=227884 RepID=A0A914P339_9BILA